MQNKEWYQSVYTTTSRPARYIYFPSSFLGYWGWLPGVMYQYPKDCGNNVIRGLLRLNINSTLICIISKCSNWKTLKNRRPRLEPWGTPVEIFCHLLNLSPSFTLWFLFENNFRWKCECLNRSHKLLVYIEGCGLWFSVSNAFESSNSAYV